MVTLGAHTAIGAAQAVLALTWKNPLGIAIGIACGVAGKQIPVLRVVAGTLAAIHLVSWDRSLDTFPQDVFGMGAVAGSCRVARTNSHLTGGLTPPSVLGSLDDVEARVLRFIRQDEMGRTGVLRQTRGTDSAGRATAFVHSRHVSLVFGFADDMFVQITEEGNKKCLVEYQGQLRLGGGDLGVNQGRAKRLFAYLQDTPKM